MSDDMLDLGDLIARRSEIAGVWEEHYNGVHVWVKFSDGTHMRSSKSYKEIRRLIFGEHDPVYFATSVCTQGLELKETL
jgi:hypothetical protein